LRLLPSPGRSGDFGNGKCCGSAPNDVIRDRPFDEITRDISRVPTPLSK